MMEYLLIVQAVLTNVQHVHQVLLIADLVEEITEQEQEQLVYQLVLALMVLN